MRRRIIVILIFSLIFASVGISEAKKVKSSLKVEKGAVTSKKQRNNTKLEGREILIQDSILISDNDKDIYNELKKCSFAGYDKEPNSNIESFILINNSDLPVTGFKVRINYLDMQNRMLHSREITEPCFIPGKESRRFDIKSWDTQHTYYYYLGNQPKRVATPYQVKFEPISFWIN